MMSLSNIKHKLAPCRKEVVNNMVRVVHNALK